MTATATAPEPVRNSGAPVAPLPAAVCEQMSRSFPLGADARKIRMFEGVDEGRGARPYAVMGDSKQQILVMVANHPYELMTDSARRLAGAALKGSEFANMGMSTVGGIFVIYDGEIVTDAAQVERRQKECLYGRAFRLTQNSL